MRNVQCEKSKPVPVVPILLTKVNTEQLSGSQMHLIPGTSYLQTNEQV